MRRASTLALVGWSLIVGSCCPFAFDEIRAPAPTLLEATTLRIFYASIGMQTVAPVTSQTIEHGDACIVSKPLDVGVIKGILASAAPARSWGPEFENAVRVKIYERTTRGESLLSTVENHGATRDARGDGLLVPQARQALKVVIEQACEFGCSECPFHHRCDWTQHVLECIPLAPRTSP